MFRSSTLALFLGAIFAQALPPENYQLATDWQLDASSFKATATKSENGDTLTLQNGLIRRVIRLKDGCATLALDDLMSGRSLVRSVRPEAMVTINGQEFAVGGLIGQPNHAFLTPEWQAALKTDPNALQLIGVEISEIKERMPWKRVRPHAPDVQWPPKGVAVRLEFSPYTDKQPITEIPWADIRTKLFADEFTQLSSDWKVQASIADERISFMNEGKPGEIYAPANTFCFAERALPANVGGVETVISPGTNVSYTWGPGLGLVFPNGKVLRCNLRPGDRGEHGDFQLSNNGVTSLMRLPALAAKEGGLSLERNYRLRVSLHPKTFIWEVADAGQAIPTWYKLFETSRDESWGAPIAMRLGKMAEDGSATDHKGEKGEWGRCRFTEVSVWSGIDTDRLAKVHSVAAPRFHVSIHYELYDGLPVWSKWMTVENISKKPLCVDRFTSEVLAVIEQSSDVESRGPNPLDQPDSIQVETDQAFGSFTARQANSHVVRWEKDPLYTSQVNYNRETPCLLKVGPTRGPAQDIAPGETFTTFRAFGLVQDSSSRERRGLAQRRMYRTLAPWVTENPLMHHLVASSPEAARAAIDQAAEVGFEMIILSFGSGFNMENNDPAYLEKWRKVNAYAQSKGIELGSYSLLSSRKVGGGNDVVPAPGERVTFGNAPALTSPWGLEYFKKLYAFFKTTGFTVLEHDGSYPGDWDVTARPPLQKGLADSQWAQWKVINEYYRWCRGQGIFLNVPDYYFLAGSNKCGMGYREVNWSLPRAEQVIHTRQNIYDGTWDRTPSMGWMFVPLSEYQGGGKAATIEPLDSHLEHYNLMMLSNLSYGVQACYRGPRLFDTPRVRDLVKANVDWFKAHRAILESDVIHVRRADGKDWDGLLHVNPQLKERALLSVFNPLNQSIEREILVPLYYAGLKDSATVSINGAADTNRVKLDSTGRAKVRLTLPPNSHTWIVFRE